MTPSNNLLLRLHKWAVRQDENFLTESFAHLLDHLLECEPEAAVTLVDQLTDGCIRLSAAQAKLLVVRTQVVSGTGTPDLELRTAEQMVIVEVKSESEPNRDQIARYRSLLRQSGMPATRLILLTRYPATLEADGDQPDRFLRWYNIAEWIELEKQRYRFQPVSQYLVEQFLSFLGARNMVMGQVTWDLPGGIRALRSLADMLYEAAAACGVKAHLWGNRESMGVYLDGRRYWLGVDYENPEVLRFTTHNAGVDRERADQLGVGIVYEWRDEPGFGWYRDLPLVSEEVHFFARSKASQLHLLESFLRECLEQVGTMVVASKTKAEVPARDEGIE